MRKSPFLSLAILGFLCAPASGWSETPPDYTPKFRTVSGDAGTIEVMYLQKGEDVVLLPVPDDFAVRGEGSRLIYESQLSPLPRIVLSFVSDAPPAATGESAAVYYRALAKKGLGRDVADLVEHPIEWDVVSTNEWVTAGVTIDFSEFNRPVRSYSVLSRFPDGRLLYSSVVSNLEDRETAREVLHEILERYTEMNESKWRERTPDA